MAIVKEIESKWGGVIRVDDSAFRGVAAEELRRRRDGMGRAILETDRRAQLAGMGRGERRMEA